MLEALRDLGRELLAALADVAVLAGDQDYFVAHMRSLGWEVTTVPPPFQSVATAGERIIDLLSSEDFEDEAVLAVLEATVRIVDAVHQLQSAPQAGFPTPAAAGEYWSTIAREFLDSMVVDYLTS